MDLADALFIQQKIIGATGDEKRRASRGEKVILGEFTRPRWTGSLPHYLFLCPACDILTVDYPHSWPERQYLTCATTAAPA